MVNIFVEPVQLFVYTRKRLDCWEFPVPRIDVELADEVAEFWWVLLEGGCSEAVLAIPAQRCGVHSVVAFPRVGRGP